ncbi:LysR family transcriptional regulator [Siccibacter colletis]|uniref:LysR family transcriptional regulator n=1 Tax=Siccibacter colletis TaxID=1505757 RepID=UPI003CFAA2B0
MSANPAIKDFDLNLIKVFDAVISAGNATRASKRLQVTPAAISQALQRLQNAYNEELFIRTREGLAPTSRAREIHSAYSQVLDIVASTLEQPPRPGVMQELTILGNDINEQYYFSQLFDYEPFTRFQIKYSSTSPQNIQYYRESLTGSTVDMVLTLKPIADSELENVAIEHFHDYCAVCALHNPLAELPDLTLYNFFSFPHAVYQTDALPLLADGKRNILLPGLTSTCSRRIGYRTDSINGLISAVENSSFIAVLPYRLARFFQIQKKYSIALLALPEELNFSSQTLYANWYRKNRRLAEVKEIVAMLQTLASFRKW